MSYSLPRLGSVFRVGKKYVFSVAPPATWFVPPLFDYPGHFPVEG